MGADGAPDMVLGTFIDPAIAYGPNAARVMATHRETEHAVIDIAPLDGPAPVGAEIAGSTGKASNHLLNPKAFVKTPVGVLLILLVLAWLAFDRVFG